MDTEILKEFGLTENESKVYLTLLKLSSATAGQIIQGIGLHRAVVYDLLGRLAEKGLISSILKGKKKFFEAASPSRFLEIIQEREEELKTREEKFKQILPSLEELSKFKSKLEVSVYKGKEGLKTIFDDVLKSGEKEWLAIGTGGKIPEILPFYLEIYHKRRIKAGIRIKAIFANTKEGRKRGKEFIKMGITEIKFLPDFIKRPVTIQIYGSKTVIYSSSEGIPFVVVINNKEIASSFKDYFKWLWEISIKADF